MTTVVATAAIDQSKYATVLVNVTSGYEALTDLQAGLTGLSYGGDGADAAFFEDLYATTWSGDAGQAVAVNVPDALASRISGASVILENYFDPYSALDVSKPPPPEEGTPAANSSHGNGGAPSIEHGDICFRNARRQVFILPMRTMTAVALTRLL